jgi:hypothetical protein
MIGWPRLGAWARVLRRPQRRADAATPQIVLSPSGKIDPTAGAV